MNAPAVAARPVKAPVLVADIGATNARFALINGAGPEQARVLQCADFPSLEAAIRAYLGGVSLSAPLKSAAFAVASPIMGDRVSLMNNHWAFSIEEIRKAFGFEQFRILNDFTALALSIPLLTERDRRRIGPEGTVVDKAPIAVVGPGTGLGVSGLVWTGASWTALMTEGGHVTMAALNDREADVLRVLRGQFDHVSAERVISGMGLQNLYRALCTLAGQPVADLTPSKIAAAGVSGECTICREAVNMFCAMLGTVAGDLAMTLGALGGLYIAGGIIPRMGDYFDRTDFRKRFEAKGRMGAYLAAVPTWLITHELPAFIGLQSVLAE
ncbi:MAG: glucokinase [Pseudomonadota bacterium]|nr:glucokinase [Pseudomonadota bacterium]